MWEVPPSPVSSGAFLTTATITSFPTPTLLDGGHHSCILGQLVYLQFCEGLPFHPSALRVPCPLCYLSFFCCCLLFSLVFSLFSLGWGQSSQGAMLMWPRVFCGSTACCLVLLVVCFSQASRSWPLAVREPSWFLRLTWSGDAMHGLGV
jgi:hypothetical protein